uniref:Wall-associated receptor kinase galacturonan-binding domain-containing protein n=1 Tax=Triticum urartu TaxID=4572 RepID=A0A8R7TS09_TRIUA
MHPTSLLSMLFSLFLLFHQRAHAGCEPVVCGNFTIKYPFWLDAPSRPPPEPSCGHPAFELWCINNNTTATMSGSPISTSTRWTMAHNPPSSTTTGSRRAPMSFAAPTSTSHPT